MLSIWTSVRPLTWSSIISFSPYWRERGSDGWTVQYMRIWLRDHTQRMVVNGSVSGWRSAMSGVPQKSLLGPLFFNNSDIHSGIKHTLSKPVDDTKRCGAADMPEGRDAIQRDLGRLQQWTQANLRRFNKSKCKVLHLHDSNPHSRYKLRMQGCSTALPKRTWRYGWMANWTWASSVPSQPREPTVSWAASKEMWTAGHGKWSCPSALCYDTSPGALCPDVESSVQERCGLVSTCPEKGHKNDPRDGTPLLCWESWGCAAWRREGSGETWWQPSRIWRGVVTWKGTDSLACDRTRGNDFTWKEGRFRLDIRKEFFTVRVMRHWNRLPREVLGALCSETFKVRLD